MTIDKTKLRELAEAATCGPYVVTEVQHKHHLGGTHKECRIFTEWNHPQLKGPLPVVNMSIGIGETKGGPTIPLIWMRKQDADYFATMDPQKTIALLDELQAQNTAIDRLEAHLKAGATIHHQEGLCCLFDAAGEGIAAGATLRAMVGKLVAKD